MGANAYGNHPLPSTVRRRLNCVAGCWLALAALLVAPASQAMTYRWVGKNGNVHYGDSLPAQFAGSSYEILDSEGRVIRHVTVAPRAAENRSAEGETALSPQALAARNQRRHDNALLATYSSTSEIDRARDRALDQEKAIVESLQVLRKQAQSPAEKEHLEKMILQHHTNMETIRAKYAADKARFRELTGKP